MKSKPIFLPSDEVNFSQLKVFFSMIILFTFYSAINYNLGAATPYIQSDLNISNSRFGIIFTTFSIIYAIGMFINGFLGDRFSAKTMMIIGAVGGIISNVLFGMSGSLTLFVILWGMNAYFLSMGWAPGCTILLNWFPAQRWGLFMGIYTAFAYLGGILIYPLAGFLITNFGWRFTFWITPILLLIWIFVFVVNVQDSPEKAGMKTEWSKARNEKEQEEPGNQEEQEKIGLREYWAVISHPKLNLVYLSLICSQIVRYGLLNWIIKILITPIALGGYGIGLVTATTIATSIHFGGAFFAITMGYISDKTFRGTRWQVIFLGSIMSGIALIGLSLCGTNLGSMSGGPLLIGAMLFLAGGGVQGVQSPLLNLPGDIMGRRLGGTGNGIACGWSYVGASLTGVALGALFDSYGYMSGLFCLALVSIIGGLVIIPVKR